MSDMWRVSIVFDDATWQQLEVFKPNDVNEFPGVLEAAEKQYVEAGGDEMKIAFIRVDAMPDPLVYIVTQSSWIDTVHATAEAARRAQDGTTRTSIAVRVVNEVEVSDRQRAAAEELHLKRIKWGLEAK